jgi:DNA-binding transcriptional LysR family regulator
VTLFERNRARVVLTDEGEKVLRLARIVVGAADEILRIRRERLRDKLAHYAKPTQPRIAVAAALIEEINYPSPSDSGYGRTRRGQAAGTCPAIRP